MKRILIFLILTGVCAAGQKPLMKDFMGLCVHTVQFKPELYKPICSHVRDYHGLNWDLGDRSDHWPTFPLAHNKVSWQSLYETWTRAGYEIDASIMLGSFPYDKWIDPARDAETYGFAFARFFGPSGRNWVTAVEVGNEPGGFEDAQYRTIFENMARGLRAGDAKMKVVTCAAVAGKSHKYAKSLECVKGLEELYDVINVHSYAQAEGWPTWRRSYPEDPSIAYLKDIRDAIDWRNENAPGKEVWITEFGWDCTTQPNAKEGTFKDWQGNTDAEQARYLVRSWLVFSAMDMDRAYMYWFNDDDKPQVHAAAGLTRNYQPKQSFWAVAHLQKTLGDYRFDAVIQQDEKAYVYRYVNGADAKKQMLVAWSPVAGEAKESITIPIGSANVITAEQMPTAEGPAPKVDVSKSGQDLTIIATERPVYIMIE